MVADLFVAAMLLSIIIIGSAIRGALGGLLIAIALALFVVGGIESAFKLFSLDGSFSDRLYHFFWVWVGIGAALIFRHGVKTAAANLRARDHD